MEKKVVEVFPIRFRVVSWECFVSAVADPGNEGPLPCVARRHSSTKAGKHEVQTRGREVVRFPVPCGIQVPSEAFEALHHVGPSTALASSCSRISAARILMLDCLVCLGS